LEEIVLEIRRRLENQSCSQKGAISILFALEKIGIKPPSVPTINRILKLIMRTHIQFSINQRKTLFRA
jgi:hypothetical protein